MNKGAFINYLMSKKSKELNNLMVLNWQIFSNQMKLKIMKNIKNIKLIK